MDTDPQLLRQLRQTKPPPAYARPVVGSAFFHLYIALLIFYFPMAFCFSAAFVQTITESSNNYFIWRCFYFIWFLLLISLPVFWLAKKIQWQYLLENGKLIRGAIIDRWYSDVHKEKKFYATIRYMPEETNVWQYMVVETHEQVTDVTIFYIPIPPYPAGFIWFYPFSYDPQLVNLRVKKPTQPVIWRSYYETNHKGVWWFWWALFSSFYLAEGKIIDKWQEYYNQTFYYYFTLLYSSPKGVKNQPLVVEIDKKSYDNLEIARSELMEAPTDYRIYISTLLPSLIAVDLGKHSHHFSSYKGYFAEAGLLGVMGAIFCILFLMVSFFLPNKFTTAEVTSQRIFMGENDNNKPQEYFEITYIYQAENEDGQAVTFTSQFLFEIADKPDIQVGDFILISYNPKIEPDISNEFIEVLPSEPILIEKRVTEVIINEEKTNELGQFIIGIGLFISLFIVFLELYNRSRGILARKELHTVPPPKF